MSISASSIIIEQLLPPNSSKHLPNLPATVLATCFETARVVSPADSPPFHIVQLPQIIARQRFQPNTANGKLNAVITPTLPNGFHCSINACSLRSEGITF